MILNIFLQSGVSTALPIIVRDLNGTEFEWVGSAYSLSATAFMPLSGGCAQVSRIELSIPLVAVLSFFNVNVKVFGRRLVLFLQIIFFAVGSALCGAARSVNFLVAGRSEYLTIFEIKLVHS